MNPGPFTLREMVWMVEERRRESWDHTSHLLAMIRNANCTRKSQTVSPLELNPFTAARSLQRRISDPRELAPWLGVKTDA